MTASLNLNDFVHAMPLVFMVGWACLVLLADALGRSKSPRLWPLAALGLLLGLAYVGYSWVNHPQPMHDLFGGRLIAMVVHDDIGTAFCQSQGNSTANSSGSTCDDGNLVCKIHSGFPLLSGRPSGLVRLSPRQSGPEPRPNPRRLPL